MCLDKDIHRLQILMVSNQDSPSLVKSVILTFGISRWTQALSAPCIADVILLAGIGSTGQRSYRVKWREMLPWKRQQTVHYQVRYNVLKMCPLKTAI